MGTFEFRRLNREIEGFELLNAGNLVVWSDPQPTPLLRLRLDPVRISQSATASDRVETALERFTTGQRKHGIHAVRRESVCGFHDVLTLPIHRDIRAQAPHEG